MIKCLITGCSVMSQAIQNRLELEDDLTTTLICRHKGYDLLEFESLGTFDWANVVINVAETGPEGLRNLCAATPNRKLLIDVSSIAVNSDVQSRYVQSKRVQEKMILEDKARSVVLRLGHIVGTKTWPVENREVADAVPLKRFGRVEEVAEAVLFLIRCEWMNKTVVTLDGGSSGR